MVGERILGRFRIEGQIGSGGFGTVYRAWDERLQRPVAVKIIDREHGAPRVTREAQAVARLGHRNIATLYELASDGDRAFLVSELIEGETLRVLGRRGELTDRLVARVGADSAAALTHAHRAGVVHRDVKPENILVCEGARQRDPSASGEAKLVDFGIARIAGERTLTATGAVVGTLAYMAPEQADGLRPGPAADVYSLALTLYECFCGEHPLIRGGPAATARAIGEPIPPLFAIRPELPEALTEAIDAALDPDPEVRPLASELEAVLAAHVDQLDGGLLPAIEGPEGEPAPERRRLPRVARFLPAAGVAALGLAALIATGAPAPIALAALVPGVLALGRARPAYALQLALVLLWVADRRRRAGGRRPHRPARRSSARSPDRPGGDRPAGGRTDPRARRARPRLPGARRPHQGRCRPCPARRYRLPLDRGVGGARAPDAPARARRRPTGGMEGFSEHRDHRCRDTPDRRPGSGGRRYLRRGRPGSADSHSGSDAADRRPRRPDLGGGADHDAAPGCWKREPAGAAFRGAAGRGGCGPAQPQGARRASDPSGISRGGRRPRIRLGNGSRSRALSHLGLRPPLRSGAAWPPLAFPRRRRPTHRS